MRSERVDISITPGETNGTVGAKVEKIGRHVCVLDRVIWLVAEKTDGGNAD